MRGMAPSTAPLAEPQADLVPRKSRSRPYFIFRIDPNQPGPRASIGGVGDVTENIALLSAMFRRPGRMKQTGDATKPHSEPDDNFLKRGLTIQAAQEATNQTGPKGPSDRGPS